VEGAAVPRPSDEEVIAAYARIFDGASKQDIELVLNDLGDFCRAFQTAFSSDARTHALIEGRREVFFRIFERAKFSPFELTQIYLERKARYVGQPER
jgi:hypothetical protein